MTDDTLRVAGHLSEYLRRLRIVRCHPRRPRPRPRLSLNARSTLSAGNQGHCGRRHRPAAPPRGRASPHRPGQRLGPRLELGRSGGRRSWPRRSRRPMLDQEPDRQPRPRLGLADRSLLSAGHPGRRSDPRLPPGRAALREIRGRWAKVNTAEAHRV